MVLDIHNPELLIRYKVGAPNAHGMLEVSKTPPHSLYWEEYGNPNGAPVMFLHGGPGGGSDKENAGFFDPKHYRIILFDQRGCKRSIPNASLEANTTQDLIGDINKLRVYLNIAGKMHLFGGSWGSTLALCYAIAHPEHVLSMTLRGIFLCRKYDIDVFYQGDAADLGNPHLQGSGRFYPEQWKRFVEPAPEEKRGDMIVAYRELMQSPDAATRHEAAKRWSEWEGACMHAVQDRDKINDFGDLDKAIAFANIENHYFLHGMFVSGNRRDQNYIIDNIGRMKDIPTEIVHGRFDMVCPLNQATDLVEAWNRAQPDENKRPVLHIMDTSGHSCWEPAMCDKLTEIMDRFRSLG